MSKIVLVTGGFDPIHTGHISYFKNAKELYPNTPLCVGLNSDDWLIRKKGKYFLPMTERHSLIHLMSGVGQTKSLLYCITAYSQKVLMSMVLKQYCLCVLWTT